ncbi:HlyC/CorC family transporter [Hazenella sp. IB182357]|uniref:HlyC/CorC family transporter n=1 Tax=Polycladospora coralii TaxID=2771432 RepID=A0A926N680_9BACL|nr:HlyC/CorC family transporter [Polycladospora coralii]MBS7531318.1 HlyC/CorC family transporter [Polycladospora coralii]
MGTILQLGLVVFLVFLNGFFVAAEFAIVKVRATQIAQLGDRRGRMAKQILKNLDAYLSATQLGITLASLGLGWVGEPVISHLLEPVFHYLGMPAWLNSTVSLVIAFSLITFMHIVLGEMAPKSIAIRKSESTTLWVAFPLEIFYRIFRPFIFVLNGSANRILKWFKIDLNENQHAHTEEEIRMLLAQSHQSGYIDQTELTLFDSVFDFTERVAREVMVPRVNMVCIYEDWPLQQNLDLMKSNHHTRFPLCAKDKDDIVGIVHIRDVYEKVIDGQEINLRELARDVVIVPETMEIKDTLRILQKNHLGMAVVVDEYGGTSGLATIEDIIEEIFGEIQDEFDQEKPFFEHSEEGTSVDAHALIDEVNEHFNLDMEDQDNDTIGGWLFSQLEKAPHIGDQVVYEKWLFTVQEVDQWRIRRILVTPYTAETKEQLPL